MKSKRILGILLTITMLISLLPTFTLTASAADSVVAWNDADKDGVIDTEEVTYSSFTDAVEAGINGTASYIRLNSDISGNIDTIYVDKGTFTIDLNGHDLALEGLYEGVMSLSGSANVTFTDTSDSWGTVSEHSGGFMYIGDNAALTINGGNYSGLLFFDSWSTVPVTINSGNFMHRDSISGSNIVFNGGTFSYSLNYRSGEWDLSQYPNPEDLIINIYVYDPTDKTDVTIADDDDDYSLILPDGYVLLDAQGQEVVTVPKEVGVSCTVGTAQSGGEGDEETTVEAKWGASEDELTKSGTLEDAIAEAEADSSITYIQLQTNIESEWYSIDRGTFTIDLNGQSVVSDDYTFSIRNSGTVITFADDAGGEVSTTYEFCPAVEVSDGGKVIIDGGKYNGGYSAVFVADSNSSATIINGEFTGTGGCGVESLGTLVIEGGIFNSDQAAVCSRGEITIKGGNFAEGEYGTIQYIDGTLDLSEYEAVEGISVTNWTVDEVTPGEDTIKLPEGYAFYDSDNNQVTTLAVDKTYTIGIAQSGGEGDEETTVEAKWGTSVDNLTESGTLEEAIAAAQANSSITYIQLQTNIESEGYAIGRGIFTIDLNGHNVASDGYTFRIQNSGTAITFFDGGDGEVSTTGGAHSAVIVLGSAEVIINGGKYLGLYAVCVANSASSATILNGEFTSTGQYSVLSYGTLVIEGGSFNAGTNAAVYTSGETTIKGGNFTFTESAFGAILYESGTLDLSEYVDVEGISVTNWTDEEVTPGDDTIKLPEGYAFYDSDNNQVTTLAANGTYTVGIFETIIAKYDEATKSATVTVKEAGTYSLIFAKYSEDNRLDKVDIVKFTFEKGINTVPQELTDLTLVTGDKIMLWKDMTNLVPLCEAYIVK